MAQYPEIANDSGGVGKDGQDLANVVQTYGSEAIPFLLEFLDDERRGVRQLAGFTINGIDGLGPEHLADLMEARENGNGWIPRSIARIGTPEALQFLANDLRKDPSTNTQVTIAFENLGAAGAPYIAELYACIENCNERVFSAASFVLREVGDSASGVIPRLLEIASDDKYAQTVRQHAIEGIGAIGGSAESYVPDLISLREQESFLAPYVGMALVSIGSSEAVSVLLEALPFDAEYVLSDIKRLGRNGFTAGPAVLAYLGDPNWDVRVTAADTLGHIGYTPASSALTNALDDKNDWKIVYAATIALARLAADKSIESLYVVRDTHWYPPVGEIANTAIRHVQLGEDLTEDEWWQFSGVEDSPEACDAINRESVEETRNQKLYQADDESELQKLSYETEIYSYDAREGTEPNKNGIVEVTNENMVELVERIQQTPTVARKISDGWLVGADRGEWGGELIHISSNGKSTKLHDGNVEDIFFVGSQIVATSGLAHLFGSRGVLLKIDRDDSGQYIASQWKRLPGAPVSSWLIEGDELLVNTYGGSVVVGEDGSMRMAECL